MEVKNNSSRKPMVVDKINRVMAYINENYVYDISREGLAAFIDVHPDNLSRLFKQYTKMRIGDYISELRIRDAARMLRETNEKISEIAYSVGFESIRTFHRVFPKFMNMTPIRYRKLFEEFKTEFLGVINP